MKCEVCDTDWTGHMEAYPQLKGMTSISTCPECPEAGVEGHDPRNSDSKDDSASGD